MFQKTSIFRKKASVLQQVTIKNSHISLTALEYGAVIQKLIVKDKNNTPVNVVTSLDVPEEYLNDRISLGATVGRFAGRISGGSFMLDGARYNLYEEAGVHLHGGQQGFGRKYWKILEVNHHEDPSVVFGYVSPHMEEGYPGELQAKITYALHKKALHITHEAITDRPTVVNLTNHSYFKLDNATDINELFLQLNCPSFLQTDHRLLPTGTILTVENTDFDFRKGKKIEDTRMDTPFIRNNSSPMIGQIVSAASGISMKIYSNQPAVVIYTPLEFPAICFETQNYPDAPNFSHFPSSVLRPGERYLNTAIFEFDLLTSDNKA